MKAGVGLLRGAWETQNQIEETRSQPVAETRRAQVPGYACILPLGTKAAAEKHKQIFIPNSIWQLREEGAGEEAQRKVSRVAGKLLLKPRWEMSQEERRVDGFEAKLRIRLDKTGGDSSVS